MTKLIVSAYSALLDAILFVLLLIGAGAAYRLIPDAIFTHDLYQYKDAIKFITGLIGTLILEIIFIGPFLVLEDMRQAVRAIEKKVSEQLNIHNNVA